MRSCWNRWFERLGEKSCLKHWTHSSSYASLANVLAVEQGGSRVAAAGAPGGWGVSKACRDCAGWRERLAEAQRGIGGRQGLAILAREGEGEGRLVAGAVRGEVRRADGAEAGGSGAGGRQASHAPLERLLSS